MTVTAEQQERIGRFLLAVLEWSLETTPTSPPTPLLKERGERQARTRVVVS